MAETVTASVDLTGRVRSVSSYHFAENAGTPGPARVLLRNGGASGPVFADIRIPASSSVATTYGRRPLLFPSGLYVEVAAGTVRGAVEPA
jgi:hypothetical protein